jgi:LPS export ABC transporter protein LptC
VTRVRGLWIAIAASLAFVGCAGDEPVASRPPGADLPTTEVRDFTLEESDQGRPEWILKSRYAAQYQNRGVILARDVAIEFFDDQGKKYSRLTAKEGEVTTPRNDLEARGDVVVTTEDGVRIETSSLRFLNRERKIVSDAFVRLERHGTVVTGVGFESDPSLEHFTLKRKVQAQVQTTGGGGLRFQERVKR